MVQDLIALLSPSEQSVTYFKYDPDGWSLSNEAECQSCEYTPPENWGVAEFLKEGRKASDKLGQETAAAAGAVVCLDLVK
jgi:hypothetical protein